MLMKRFFQSHIVTTGLAIFSMFFGAGNLMFPLQVGVETGTNVGWGIFGFLITAACLPVMGLLSMILFDGDYKAFFYRLGLPTGSMFILLCMIIIGPLIAIPRIVTLSHVMIAPFIPITLLQTITPLSSFIFSLIFLGTTFLLTYRENNIVDILGYVISPLLLISLTIIIIKGYLYAGTAAVNTQPISDILWRNITRGYETLDLLGGIFFSSIVLTILRKTVGRQVEYNPRALALIGLKAGTLGVGLLALVYIGMSMLGVYYGQDIDISFVNSGEIFSLVSKRVLGDHGALVIATAVLMACLSTSIALSAVIGEYIQYEISKNTMNYVPSVAIGLLASIPLSTAGLDHVLTLTGGPITYIGYPVIIVLTICNILYKLFDFKPVKLPVFLTFLVVLVSYLRYFN